MRLLARQGSNKIKEIKGDTNKNRKVNILIYLSGNMDNSDQVIC